MPLTAATRLGVYEISAPLGAGGMGEVYRARDTRIDRDVAVKILPGPYVADSDRLRRFEQEARAAGALNHPNVLTLHDVGRHEGTPYIVSELLEGETLRSRLSRGPLRVEQAVDHAVQIARGLAAAHDKGIVHRDLKPENVFVTRDGRVKVLDFGLAKLTERPAPSVEISHANTETRRTEPGAVMGTAGYMSPEQVRAQPADHRSDVFALGAILHEMLTGQRAFAAGTSVETMNAVLTVDPPPVDAKNEHVPPVLARIVRRCLEKAPESRFQSAHDLAFALDAAVSIAGPAQPSSPRAAPRRWLPLAAALAAGAIIAVAVVRGRAATAPGRPLWTSILPPPDTAFVTTSQRLALSPEGTRVAFLALNRQGRSWLWVRDLSEPSVRAIAETDSFATPFWSPDGKTLAFGAGRKLRRLDLATGAVHDVCDAPRMRGGAWNRRGDIVFAPLTNGAIHRVPASGGAPAAVTRLDLARGEYSHRWPSFLPDGRHFLFLAQGRTEAGQSADVYIGAIDGGAPRLLLRDASNAEYVSSGHIVFARQGSLLAAPFDPEIPAITGEPLLVSRDVRYMKPSELSAFSVASNGTLAYLTSAASESRLQWLDRSGKTIEEVEEQAGTMLGNSLRLSRDGRSIAFVRLDAQMNGHLWIHDRRLRTTTRVISEPRFFQGVAWSPDGSRLVSSSVQTGGIREKAVGRADEETVLLKPLSRSLVILDWSPDARSILFAQLDPATGWDVWALPHGPGGEASPILRTPFNENDARVSPDARWLAYATDESGRTDVYVSAFPRGDGRRWPVSNAGGRRPTWGKDGRELYYFSPDGKLMVVDVQPGMPIEFSSPRVLFDFPGTVLDFERFAYDAAPDGQRFLVHLPHGREAPPSMTLVSNWTQGLVR